MDISRSYSVSCGGGVGVYPGQPVAAAMAGVAGALCPRESGSERRRRARRSKYRHVPHCEKPPVIVERRNARERRRVDSVNKAFGVLRRHIPVTNRQKRLSKVKTLQVAIRYIAHLKELLHDFDAPVAHSDFPCGGVQTMLTSAAACDVRQPFDATYMTPPADTRLCQPQSPQRDCFSLESHPAYTCLPPTPDLTPPGPAHRYGDYPAGMPAPGAHLTPVTSPTACVTSSISPVTHHYDTYTSSYHGYLAKFSSYPVQSPGYH